MPSYAVTEVRIIEERLNTVLEILTEFYKTNSLYVNTSKTQVCTSHLNNHQANRKLEIH